MNSHRRSFWKQTAIAVAIAAAVWLGIQWIADIAMSSVPMHGGMTVVEKQMAFHGGRGGYHGGGGPGAMETWVTTTTVYTHPAWTGAGWKFLGFILLLAMMVFILRQWRKKTRMKAQANIPIAIPYQTANIDVLDHWEHNIRTKGE